MSNDDLWTSTMKRSMTNENDQQMRKAAILIGSLDEALAEQMLAEMPAAAAQAVRETIARLDDVDAEEARDIVDQFRRGTRRAVPHDIEGVELDASLLARIEQHDAGEFEQPVEERRNLLAEFTDAEAATIVDALSREHPQTVAVVISRLDQVAAAKILSLLSPNLQVEVLERVAELDPADVQSLQVVESHLAQWINQKRQRTERMAAGAELAQRILQGTSQEDRAAILTRLDSRNPKLAKRFGQSETGAGQSADPQPPRRPKITRERFEKAASLRRAGKLRASNEVESSAKPEQAASPDPLGELEKLDDATLMETFTQSDRQIVTLALAGASEVLMKRILRRLPRRQAKEFRKRLRDIGPTRLSDMFAAQQQLARNARQLV
jgi:flagellar motor switch protein FliG